MSETSAYSVKSTGNACQIRIDPYRLRSSCIPVPDTIKEIILLIKSREGLGSEAAVYDTCGHFLFNLLIDADTVVLHTNTLKGRSAMVSFGNKYSVYIN